MNNTISTQERQTPLTKKLADLRSKVDLRNQMSGAMYFNIMNDEACFMANEAKALGASHEELTMIVGRENFR